MQRDSVDHITKARRPTMRTRACRGFMSGTEPSVVDVLVGSGVGDRLPSRERREAGAAFGDQDRTVGVHAFHDATWPYCQSAVQCPPTLWPRANTIAARHAGCCSPGIRVHERYWPNRRRCPCRSRPEGSAGNASGMPTACTGGTDTRHRDRVAGVVSVAVSGTGRAIAGHRIVHAAGAAGIVVIGRRSRRRCRRGSGIVVRVVVRTRLLLVVSWG